MPVQEIQSVLSPEPLPGLGHDIEGRAKGPGLDRLGGVRRVPERHEGAVADLGGLIAAIDAMRAHPTCRGAQLQGCRAVATIAAGSDALEERAKAEGALRAAVCCLQAATWSKWHDES